MKKCIICLAIALAFAGYANAQKGSSAKPAQQKTTKSGTGSKAKETTKGQAIKDTSTHKAKIKLEVMPVDTSEAVIPGKKGK